MSTPTQSDDGGPAFPTENERQVGHNEWHYQGMTLRDYFAGQEQLSEWDGENAVPPNRMCEVLAGTMPATAGWSAKTEEEWLAILKWEATWRARLRYIRADAMLAARKEAAQ